MDDGSSFPFFFRALCTYKAQRELVHGNRERRCLIVIHYITVINRTRAHKRSREGSVLDFFCDVLWEPV